MIRDLDDLPAMLSPKVLAEFLDVTPTTLMRWRNGGIGPMWVQPHGSSFIRYPRKDVADWLCAGTQRLP